ncbi:MAG TPA: DUF456 family protein [Syntrophomonadaceae bacterium]|nr:DUF456 family protein [Syntrophomonadaceae bacterium]
MHTVILAFVILLMAAGLIGIVIPVLPGVGLIWIAMAAYGWYEGFHIITVQYLILMGVLVLMAIGLSYLSTMWGARYTGASKAGAWGAFLGSLIGVWVLPPLGLLLFPWLGAFVGEYIANQDPGKAALAGVGAVIGLFSGMLIHLLIGLVMLITFLIRVF